jgi:hypothetical protein
MINIGTVLLIPVGEMIIVPEVEDEGIEVMVLLEDEDVVEAEDNLL